ncbi:hypothetical protein NEMIN01_1985 [Nematocida minor]|uniref:uncharacterized protein n=1 Tax=Nematocida minor TaxID=1912983 RepID=UPI0022211BB9|nr:uncharacterized protein NEMIN01_1985 [Nematocida minor]KAI5192371.1 hypothetical protein NEMIN01_1985 [Nematocida minor]
MKLLLSIAVFITLLVSIFSINIVNAEKKSMVQQSAQVDMPLSEYAFKMLKTSSNEIEDSDESISLSIPNETDEGILRSMQSDSPAKKTANQSEKKSQHNFICENSKLNANGIAFFTGPWDIERFEEDVWRIFNANKNSSCSHQMRDNVRVLESLEKTLEIKEELDTEMTSSIQEMEKFLKSPKSSEIKNITRNSSNILNRLNGYRECELNSVRESLKEYESKAKENIKNTCYLENVHYFFYSIEEGMYNMNRIIKNLTKYMLGGTFHLNNYFKCSKHNAALGEEMVETLNLHYNVDYNRLKSLFLSFDDALMQHKLCLEGYTDCIGQVITLSRTENKITAEKSIAIIRDVLKIEKEYLMCKEIRDIRNKMKEMLKDELGSSGARGVIASGHYWVANLISIISVLLSCGISAR